jgi:hypothetical protein
MGFSWIRSIRDFFKVSLRREILIALLIKGLLLTALWYVCFRDPVENHLTNDSMQQFMFGKTTSQGENHVD